jgi:putative membrane protein
MNTHPAESIRKPFPAILALSAVIVEAPDWVSALPAANATFNSLSALCLVFGYVNIRRRNRVVHERFMWGATTFSGLFLISYITYHFFHGDTHFPGQGLIRPVYFFVLITHIGLSMVALPLILATLWYSVTGRFQFHRRIAKWTFPIWLYVSVTGVLVFFILKAYTA